MQREKYLICPYDDQRTYQKDPFITCQSSSLWMLLMFVLDSNCELQVNDVIDWFDTPEMQAIYDNMMKKGIFEAWMNNYRKRELWKCLEIGGNHFLEVIDNPKKVKFVFESYTLVSSLMKKVEDSIVDNMPVMVGFKSHLDGSAFHHIFNVVGFNDVSWICHDPYGDWNLKYKDKNVKVEDHYPGEYVSYHKKKLIDHINKHGLFIKNT